MILSNYFREIILNELYASYSIDEKIIMWYVYYIPTRYIYIYLF